MSEDLVYSKIGQGVNLATQIENLVKKLNGDKATNIFYKNINNLKNILPITVIEKLHYFREFRNTMAHDHEILRDNHYNLGIQHAKELLELLRQFDNSSLNKNFDWTTQIIKWSDTNKLYLPKTYDALKQLKKLNLKYSKIETLPPFISDFSNLKIISLGGSKIKNLPNFIGNFSKLEQIYLWKTSIQELPNSIINLAKLEKLYLWQSQITELPESIDKLTKLNELDLSGSKINKLPDSIINLKNLKRLFICNTSISNKQKKNIMQLLPKTEIFI